MKHIFVAILLIGSFGQAFSVSSDSNEEMKRMQKSLPGRAISTGKALIAGGVVYKLIRDCIIPLSCSAYYDDYKTHGAGCLFRETYKAGCMVRNTCIDVKLAKIIMSALTSSFLLKQAWTDASYALRVE